MKNYSRPSIELRRAVLPLLLALCCAGPGACRAEEAAALLAKGSGLYFETFLAFQKALGRPLPAFDLSAEKPRRRNPSALMP